MSWTPITGIVGALEALLPLSSEPAPVPPSSNADVVRPDQSASALLNLPHELLAAILDYVYAAASMDTLRSLRLTCRDLNAIVEPRIVGQLTIPNATYNAELWEALVSPESAFARGTHTLKLLGVKSDPTPRRGAVTAAFVDFLGALTDPSPEDAQRKYVAQVLGELKSVKNVYWCIPSRFTPSDRVLSALKSMPHLESIHFELNDYQERAGLIDLSGFANLTSIKLSVFPRFDTKQGSTIDHVSHEIANLLAACPGLQTLGLVGSQWEAYISIDMADIVLLLSILGGVEGLAKSTVKTLQLVSMPITPTPEAMAYLANLTSLSIDNDRVADDALWDALRAPASTGSNAARIKLRVVKVAVLSDALLGYLASYRGLREFHGIVRQKHYRVESTFGNPSPFRPSSTSTNSNTNTNLGSEAQLKEKLYREVLPLHESTLEVFGVYTAKLCYNESADAQRWAVCTEQIAAVAGMGRLKSVEVAFMHDAEEPKRNGRPGSLSDLITQLLSLPNENLKTIKINAFGYKPQCTCGEAVRKHLKFLADYNPLPGLTSHLKDLSAANGAVRGRELIIYGRTCPIVYDASSGGYRFDVGWWADDWEKAARFILERDHGPGSRYRDVLFD